MAPKLTLYGMDASQPCRSVSWLLRSHKTEFTYVRVMPGSKKPNGSRAPKFLAELNPLGNVPVLRVEEEGRPAFTLYESNAILTYLAEKYDYVDMYPKDDTEKRGLIQQWLNYMSNYSRTFTLATFAPVMRPDLKIPQETVDQQMRSLNKIAKFLDQALSKSKFLVGNSATLADIAVYADVGQCGEKYCNTFDFKPFANLSRWLNEMETLDGFKESHRMLLKVAKMFSSSKL